MKTKQPLYKLGLSHTKLEMSQAAISQQVKAADTIEIANKHQLMLTSLHIISEGAGIPVNSVARKLSMR
jgi:hypothetical protein